ncbi:MAG: hypothetical protein RMK74_12415 [Myxococcales bacterium]|nr:hypothetical protein [Myxococcales bacterium]
MPGPESEAESEAETEPQLVLEAEPRRLRAALRADGVGALGSAHP